MNSFVRDDLARATTFFTLAFVVTVLGGIALGEPRSGIELGLGLGVVFGVFAYFFLVPTTDDGAENADTVDPDAEE